MKLLLVEKGVFQKQFPKVEPHDIGLVERKILGIEAYSFCWDPDLDRDDSVGGRHQLAQTLVHLRGLLETIRLEGVGGYHVTGGIIYRDRDVIEDIRRLERDPDYDYSHQCYSAYMWFIAKAELHNL